MNPLWRRGRDDARRVGWPRGGEEEREREQREARAGGHRGESLSQRAPLLSRFKPTLAAANARLRSRKPPGLRSRPRFALVATPRTECDHHWPAYHAPSATTASANTSFLLIIVVVGVVRWRARGMRCVVVLRVLSPTTRTERGSKREDRGLWEREGLAARRDAAISTLCAAAAGCVGGWARLLGRRQRRRRPF